MATLDEIKKVLAKELDPLKKYLASIDDNFAELKNSVDFERKNNSNIKRSQKTKARSSDYTKVCHRLQKRHR